MSGLAGSAPHSRQAPDLATRVMAAVLLATSVVLWGEAEAYAQGTTTTSAPAQPGITTTPTAPQPATTTTPAAPQPGTTAVSADQGSALATTAGSALDLVPPSTETQTIELGPLINGERTGRLSLIVENTTKHAGVLEIAYLRNQGRPIKLVPGLQGRVVRLVRPTSSAPKISAGGVRQVTAEFTLTADQGLGVLDGQLIFKLTPVEGRPATESTKPQTPLVVAVSAEVQPLEGVSVEPTNLTMQATQFLPEVATGTSATVRLLGPGVGALVADDPAYEPSALLSDGKGHSIIVKLSDIRGKGDAREATVRTDSTLHAGEYAGTLLLGGSASDPRIAITFRSHHWVVWAILAVLVGSILGGLLPLVSGTWRRKQLLRAELKGILERYKEVRDQEAGPPPTWDLDPAIGDEPWFTEKWYAMPRLQGASGLYSSIRWSRTSADLDDDTLWVLDLSARVQRWLRLGEPARKLQEVFLRTAPDRADKQWRKTALTGTRSCCSSSFATNPHPTRKLNPYSTERSSSASGMRT